MSAVLRVGACLSLSGPYARFGAQARQALRVWQDLAGGVEVTVADDHGSVRILRETLPTVATRCDLLLGPYATHLAHAAAEVVSAERGLVLWNHGGAGDDMQTCHPGHVVSVPAPASRYADPFVRLLADHPAGSTLWIVPGRGGFGRQVAAGAARRATRLGINTVVVDTATDLPVDSDATWDLLAAGSFDEDVRSVTHAFAARRPPRTVCAVAAGVSEFGHAVPNPDGVFGVAQWAPGLVGARGIGPREEDFVDQYARRHGTAPDYPAVQAAAAAVLATHCAGLAGSTRREDLWAVAASLDTTTLFGRFAIDPVTGKQVGHDTVLVRWDSAGHFWHGRSRKA